MNLLKSLLFTLVLLGNQVYAQNEPLFETELEMGLFFQGRNDVRIPNSGGTLISLGQFGSGPFPNARGTVLWSPWERHYFRLLIAPLTVVAHGVLDRDTNFNDVIFAGDTSTQGVYRFNSFRLTYAYRFFVTPKWELAVGFTGKIRDAEVGLRQGLLASTSYNVGFVPLLHFFAEYTADENWSFVFDGDGLAAPQGRAFDLAFKVFRRISEDWRFYAGYRTIEGGTDGAGGTFNFAWLHATFLGFQTSY